MSFNKLLPISIIALLIIISALFLLNTQSPKPAKAQTYTVELDHPRILFTQADLPKLRCRIGLAGYEGQCNQFGSHQAEFNDMVATMNGLLGEAPAQMAAEERREFSTAWAFIYAMNGDTTHSDKAIEVVNWIIDNSSPSGLYHSFALARVFDWCYEKLTEAEKTSFRNKIIEAGDYSVPWALSFDAYHEGIINVVSLPELGLAIYEGPDDAKAIEYIDTSIDLIQNRLIPSMEEVGEEGSWHSGASYDFRSGWSWPIDMIAPLKIGAGVDLSDIEHLKNAPYFWAHRLVDESQFLSGNDYGGNEDGFMPLFDDYGYWYYLSYLYPSIEQAQLGQWLNEQNAYTYQKAIRYWRSIIFNDKGPTLHPSSIPTERWFESGGIATMRSGWDLSDASTENLAKFRIEMYTSGHSNLHQGHFDIVRGQDRLAIDAGYYDSYAGQHQQMYRMHTFAHNSLIVNDQGQPNRYEATSLHLAYPDASTKCFRGLIDGYQTTTDYVYSWGDITPAYDSSLVSNFTRDFLFLKPDYFIVFDRVSSAQPSYSKKWLLHMTYQPQLVDGSWNGGTTPNAYGGTPGQSSDNSDTYVIEKGNSKLFVKTLLPENSMVTRIGGPDSSGNYHTAGSYEAYVNGVNYPSSKIVNIERMGGWRIEVEPTQQQTDDYFLHLMQATDNGTTNMIPTTLVDEGDYYGVIIDDPSLTYNKVLFSKTTAGDYQVVSAAQPQEPNITLSKQVDKSEASSGDTLTYTITYQNQGTGDAQNIVISDAIPQGTTYVPGSAQFVGTPPAGATVDDTTDTITWTIPSVAAGTTGTVSFKATVE